MNASTVGVADCDYCNARNHALCVPGKSAYAGGAGKNKVFRPCACKRRGHRARQVRAKVRGR